MREKQLLGFTPLHACLRYHCALCGTQVSQDNAIKRTSRPDLMSEDEVILFCQVCAPEIDRICSLLAGEEARICAEQEGQRKLQLQEIAEAEMAHLRSKIEHDGGGSSAPPSDERTSPRSLRRRPTKRQGMIPNPNA